MSSENLCTLFPKRAEEKGFYRMNNSRLYYEGRDGQTFFAEVSFEKVKKKKKNLCGSSKRAIPSLAIPDIRNAQTNVLSIYT